MKSVVRFILRRVFRLLLFLVLAMAVGCLVPQSCHHTETCSDPVTVYFINHGYHTSIAVPTSSVWFDWATEFSMARGSALLQFGWGDRDFYMSRDFPLVEALEALFLPTPSVMHVVAFDTRYSTILSNAEVMPVGLCPQQYMAMAEYIRSSLQRDSLGRPVYIAAGFFGRSGFYEAQNYYYCFNNCNTWVAGALRAAGRQTPLWDGIPQSIRWHLQQTVDTAGPAPAATTRP